ncbi:MAG: hypothetical protein M0Z41_20560 [Peptococcaceae bacterium]|nr:hypothetical protein [Peptococcaceae bacterium]
MSSATITNALIRFGERVFPPTIHPMIVHFPIALLYVTLLADTAAHLSGRPQDRFFERMGFFTLTLSLMAIVAAGGAGMISEQFVHWTSATQAILAAHRRDAVLTGIFALAAWILRWFARYPDQSFVREDSPGWRSALCATRGRLTIWSTACVVGAVVMVSITGAIGGTMVYGYGAGVVHDTLKFLNRPTP